MWLCLSLFNSFTAYLCLKTLTLGGSRCKCVFLSVLVLFAQVPFTARPMSCHQRGREASNTMGNNKLLDIGSGVPVAMSVPCYTPCIDQGSDWRMRSRFDASLLCSSGDVISHGPASSSVLRILRITLSECC